MKLFLKRLAAVGLGLGISLAGFGTAQAVGSLHWTANQVLHLDAANIDMTVASGSDANSLIVDTNNIRVVVGNGDTFTITSARTLVPSGVTTALTSGSCTTNVYTLVITGGAGAETIAVTPTALCGASSGGGSSKKPTPPAPTLGAAHSAGSVVKTSDGTVWFITTDGHRRAFTSGGAFLSYGFLSFAMVVDANAADIALPTGSFIPPQDGKLICSDRDDSYAKKGTCYLITAGKRAAFTSSAVFTGQGFKFSRSTSGDVSFMSADTNISSATAAHRPGVLVNNAGTIQLVGPFNLMGIPSESVFTSWGYSFADTVPANAADKAMTQSGVMQPRATGQLSPQ